MTAPHLLLSEWLKLATLRSTWITLGAYCAAGLLLAFAFLKVDAGIVTGAGVSAAQAGAQAVDIAASGAGMASLFVLIAFAVVPATSEYRTGQIRATLTAASSRPAVLAAKTAVVGAVAAVAATVTLAGGVGLSWLLAPGADGHISLSATDWRVLGGTLLYTVLLAAMCHGLGWLIRSSAGGLVAAYGIFTIAPMVLSFVYSTSWGEKLMDYWPSNIGMSLATADPVHTWGGHWGGAAIMAGYAAVILAAATVNLVR
ncbi:MAG: ABC transporter permease, partial [Propionibacteriaceae bacterium]|nr:ABC transporter permease [Propionibacteriaceae bacterium]